MKHVKILLALALLFPLLLCMSCIDYVQSVSYKNGSYQLYYKITLSKLLLSMAEEDPDALFGEIEEEAFDGLPAAVAIKPVNTDLEVGAELSAAISAKTADKDERALLPTVFGTKCYIPFLLGKDGSSFAEALNDGDSDTQAVASAILSSAKCRVLVSKSLVPRIEAAYFEGRGGQNWAIPLFDYGDMHCLEIPFILLSQSSMYHFDRIVLVQGK